MAQDARDITFLAGVFVLAAERCREPRPLPGGSMEAPIAAAIVCAAFSVELSLKAILTVQGKTTKGHKLDELFDQVSNPIQSEIIVATKLDEVTFRKQLSDVAGAFIEWRYVYEKDYAHVDMGFLFALAASVRDVSLKLIT